MAELGIRAPVGVAAPWLWAGCALGSLGYALSTHLGPHRVWGTVAAGAYAVAAAVAHGTGRGKAARLVAVAGAVVLPLCLLVARGSGQLEVSVVARSGQRLLATGSPYVADPARVADADPYLPGMAVFGVLPGDPRWWMAGVFLACLGLCARGRVWWLVACPVVALPLAVSGVDLPVAGLLCLGLVWAGRGWAVRSGAVLGAAACLKWTAWPGVLVGVALVGAVAVSRSARNR
ncbi:hypothetical protein G3I40_16150, partial [Streptomyces sp. SID14478]|nr:hypothetical protein [Streptomyces sp. SID14478]